MKQLIRFAYPSPWRNIHAVKVPRTNIMPFTLPQIDQLLRMVRPDFQACYTVRFFTGLRSSELHGLTWRHVDFERRQLLIYQAWVRNQMIPTKTDGSYRCVQMSERVFSELRQHQITQGNTCPDDYVFSSRSGTPLEDRNVAKRVWYPLLRILICIRKPYQTRHTTATLWLVAGESPEWIVRQLGHSSTQMLFRVYSRYVPDLTGRDGSIEMMIQQQRLKQMIPN